MSGLAKKLVAAQAEMPGLQKSSINPFFKNRYVSLESVLGAVIPVLNNHGILLIQAPSISYEGGGMTPTLQTQFIDADSGEMISFEMLLMQTKDDPQGQGSAITYARRYSLMAMLGLVADVDDDGERAVNRPYGNTTEKNKSKSTSGSPDTQENPLPF